MPKKRLSRDQKRKAKLVRRAQKEPMKASLAYDGNKYKTDELIPVHLATETGIYAAFQISDGELTDHHVRGGLEKMVMQMRGEGLPPFEHSCQGEHVAGQEEELVIWGVRHTWHHYFEAHPHPGGDNLIGVLRTILNSIETWSTPGKQSRGYLTYLRGFLRKAGYDVDEVEEEDELYERGAEYCEERTPEAGEAFFELANEVLAEGDWEHVAEVAQELLGEYADEGPVAELSALSLRAQKARPQLPGPES